MPIVALVIIGLYLALQIVAATKIPMVGDEPDDFEIIATDAPGILHFFDAAKGYEYDQSRLPYYLSAPFLFFLGERGLVPLRFLFLVFHALYLLYSFKLCRVLTRNTIAAWAYTVLVATSCYLASFSIFAITTSDNLYLLFHVMVLYYFLESYGEQEKSHVFPRYVLLAALFALCIASKLFGVLLMAAVIVFHLLGARDRAAITMRSISPKRLIAWGAGFCAAIGALNLLPVGDRVKLAVAFVLCVGYLIFIGRCIVVERRGRFPAVQTGIVRLWVAITVTSFSLTLILSPVYLNVRNFLSVFGWFDKWSSGLLVARSHYYDMLVIILMKYGFVATAALAVVCVAWLGVRKTGAAPIRRSPVMLLVLVFVVHVVVISATKHKVTWYPLAVFPFLYLPVAWLVGYAFTAQRKRLAVLALAALAVIIADNGVRYFRWYPYGHFDGAQYGNEYIGWNRAGLVSFEILPELFVTMQALGSGRPVTVSCQVVDVPLYNEWVADLLRQHFRAQGMTHLTFSGKALDRSRIENSDYVLTSPIYYPQAEQPLEAWGFERQKTFSLKGLAIATVWQRAGTPSPR